MSTTDSGQVIDKKGVELLYYTKENLPIWVTEALKDLGGSATILAVAKHIWSHREAELRSSDNLFFKWQYDMRWAANRLRNTGVMKSVDDSTIGVWELK